MSQKLQPPTSMSGKKNASQSPVANKAIGEALRKEYKGVLNEPIPDKLNSLIAKLRDAETKD